MATSMFVSKVKAALDAKGMSAYKLAQAAGMSESHVYNVLHGRREPTGEVISQWAPVLGLDPDELLALADADRLGPGGLDRLVRFVIGQVDAHAFNPFAALAGDEPPALDDQELAAVADLVTLVGDLAAYSPAYRPNGQGWRQPAGARLAALRTMIEEAREDAARAKQVNAKERA